MKAMLDSMIFDCLIADEAAAMLVRQAVTSGHLQILITHIQEDQHAAIPDAEKLAKLAEARRELNVEVIATHGAVYGVSRYGRARYTDEGDRLGQVLNQVQVGNTKHAPDALIAATAAGDVDVLVTEDGLLRRRMQRVCPEIPVWRFQDLINYLSPARP
jgi:hypothetical protein